MRLRQLIICLSRDLSVSLAILTECHHQKVRLQTIRMILNRPLVLLPLMTMSLAASHDEASCILGEALSSITEVV